ncbi:MAG: hypothetical protein NTY37_12780 [Methanothrix sp.]|nr:hypothetical protein [Methanothrix sp.]
MSPGNFVPLSQGGRIRLIAGPLKNLDPASGTVTPIWFGDKVLKDYPKGVILEVLDKEFKKNAPNGKPLAEHRQEYWECFDRAYWAVSALRCQCPGAPCAVATTGRGFVAGKEEDHAVIYFYTYDGKNWIPQAWDPQRGEINDFKPKSAVFLPIFRPHFDPGNVFGLKEKKVLPPFDQQFKLKETLSGWTMLYEAEGGYDVSYFDEIKNKLQNKEFPSCQPPPDTDKKKFDVFQKMRNREDRAFFLYNQIRGKYNRSAVAFCWGSIKKENDPLKKDSAVIILWKGADDCIFWSAEGGKVIANEEFDPKFVLG